MKVHLGPAGNCLAKKGEGTIGSIRHVAELRLDAQEIEFVRGVYMKNEAAKEIGKEAERLGVKLSVHAPYYVNLCNPEKLKASEKRILDSCERAHYMGADIVVFHPGYYGKLEKGEALEMVLDSCRGMAKILRKNKWDVLLGLETTGKVSQFGTVEEVLSVCKKESGCAPVIDWSHLYAKYQGRVDFGEVLEKVVSSGYRRIHTHFSNIEFTERGERRHLTLEHKKPDFLDVAKVILGSSLEEITIISESPVLEKDSLVMKKVMEGLGFVF